MQLLCTWHTMDSSCWWQDCPFCLSSSKETFSLVQTSGSAWVSLHLVPSAPFTLWSGISSSHSSALRCVFTVTPKSSQTLTFTSHPRSITCVQPFKNKALRPPQPLTSAWMPSLVTWSHQEMFNCSNSGQPSLRIKQTRQKCHDLLFHCGVHTDCVTWQGTWNPVYQQAQSTDCFPGTDWKWKLND